MDQTTALNIVQDIQTDMGEGLLETLMYMADNLDQFSEREQIAFRVAFAGFRKLFLGWPNFDLLG